MAQLIGWWRCRASTVIQPIVSLTPRQSLQRSALRDLETMCLVPTYWFAFLSLLHVLYVDVRQLSNVATPEKRGATIFRLQISTFQMFVTWTQINAKTITVYILQWQLSHEDKYMIRKENLSENMNQVVPKVESRTKFWRPYDYVLALIRWTAGPSQIRARCSTTQRDSANYGDQ